MSQDIRDILDSWEYDPDNTIRVFTAFDGRSVMQVRLPLGIEQYEMDGRPDGYRPKGFETLLASVEKKIEEHILNFGNDDGYIVDHDEFVKLQNEGILFYYRYLLLFQMNDFYRVVRDTGHNMRLCELAEKYAEKEEDKIALLQFRPYILRMNAIAQSMLYAQDKHYGDAAKVLEEAINEIEALQALPSAVFQFERSRSLSYLQSALSQLKEKEDSPRTALENELKQALDEENYERAAELRDRIRGLSSLS